jgi:hypothetical protein
MNHLEKYAFVQDDSEGALLEGIGDKYVVFKTRKECSLRKVRDLNKPLANVTF